jgi:hypothetical protein
MRATKLFVLAALAVALFPATSEAGSRWSVSVGYNSGGWCGPGGGLSIGYGYSYGYRPSFVYGGGYYRSYCPPVYAAPVYAPRYYAPAYCPPPVYYSTPRFDNCGYAYSAPVYYSTPRFTNRSYVSVSYGRGYGGYDRGYTYVNRGYSYVDRGYNYCPPAATYAYSSYHRR